MHELSIAYSLAEVAEEAANAAHAKAVNVVYLRLGQLSGVVVDALQFGWEIATAGTVLAGAQLAIEELPIVVYCTQCNRNVALASAQWFRCPVCDAPTPTVVQGREIELTSMEIVNAEGTDDKPAAGNSAECSQ